MGAVDLTVGEALRAAAKLLEAAGCDTPAGDAQWIAAHVLSSSRTLLLAHPDVALEDGQRTRFEDLVARRSNREPLAYLLGTVSFRGLTLEVGPGALVPRAETEMTAERAIARARERGARPTVVDIGTGTGAIALAVAAEVLHARVFATESSGAARGWALRNLARTGLRVTLLPGDVMDPLHPALGGAVDVVVSNPPYVPEADWAGLPDEVRKFEPREAVVSGTDGLDMVLRILEEAPRWLAHGGWLVLEISAEQSERVAKLVDVVGYDEVTVTKDLAGRERVVEGRWTGGR
jgi:release factor glutamine methyltransferase